MGPLARPHGISPEPFLVYPPDLRHWVTVAFWTLRLAARLSASVALLSSSCSSGHDFAMASSPLHLTAQSLPVAIGFVGNYAPWDFHPSFGTCPSYRNQGGRALPFPPFSRRHTPIFLSLSKGSLLNQIFIALTYEKACSKQYFRLPAFFEIPSR